MAPMPQKSKGDFPDMPVGLGMSLAQNNKAFSYFGSLSESDKAKVINYVKGSSTGEQAKSRVQDAVNMLSENRNDFT
jgi:hypothetical protein